VRGSSQAVPPVARPPPLTRARPPAPFIHARPPHLPPAATLTARGGPIPVNAFVLMVAGDGNSAVPRFDADVVVPVSYGVYLDCGSGCASPVLERTVSLYSGLAGTDRYGNRMFGVNSGSYGCGLTDTASNSRCESTFRHLRLVPSDDRGTVISGGFDAYSGYNLVRAATRASGRLATRGIPVPPVTSSHLTASPRAHRHLHCPSSPPPRARRRAPSASPACYASRARACTT
jgi:hypothetical protein